MCGIVGVFSSRSSGITFNDEKIFKQMLYADALRGTDSTGVFGATYKDNEVLYAKAIGSSTRLMGTDSFKNFDEHTLDLKFMIGHNRAATRGAVSADNAHPFVEDHIILVHNGTLKSYYGLVSQGEHARINVDSQAIAHSIATKGWEETLPEVDGAFALIWYDMKEKALYVARNNERPLWFMMDKSRDSAFIASEWEMCNWIMKRNNTNPFVYKGTNYIADEFKPGHVYKFPINMTQAFDSVVPVKIPEKKKKEYPANFPVATPKKVASGTSGGKKHTATDGVIKKQVVNNFNKGRVSFFVDSWHPTGGSNNDKKVIEGYTVSGDIVRCAIGRDDWIGDDIGIGDWASAVVTYEVDTIDQTTGEAMRTIYVSPKNWCRERAPYDDKKSQQNVVHINKAADRKRIYTDSTGVSFNNKMWRSARNRKCMCCDELVTLDKIPNSMVELNSTQTDFNSIICGACIADWSDVK